MPSGLKQMSNIGSHPTKDLRGSDPIASEMMVGAVSWHLLTAPYTAVQHSTVQYITVPLVQVRRTGQYKYDII